MLFCLECNHLFESSRIGRPCPNCGDKATIPAANWAPAKYGMPKLENKGLKMNDRQHKDLIEIACEIGAIADMPHWVTAGLAIKIDPDQDLKEITIGELLDMKAATAKHINTVIASRKG